MASRGAGDVHPLETFLFEYAKPNLEFNEVISGKWFISQTPYGPLVHARLEIAEENSGKLVTLVRNKAKEIARSENRSSIITDGPPGIGCPVIASLAGASLALVVTESTFSAHTRYGTCAHSLPVF